MKWASGGLALFLNQEENRAEVKPWEDLALCVGTDMVCTHTCVCVFMVGSMFAMVCISIPVFVCVFTNVYVYVCVCRAYPT